MILINYLSTPFPLELATLRTGVETRLMYCTIILTKTITQVTNSPLKGIFQNV